jgi:hypothetical protein
MMNTLAGLFGDEDIRDDGSFIGFPNFAAHILNYSSVGFHGFGLADKCCSSWRQWHTLSSRGFALFPNMEHWVVLVSKKDHKELMVKVEEFGLETSLAQVHGLHSMDFRDLDANTDGALDADELADFQHIGNCYMASWGKSIPTH